MIDIIGHFGSRFSMATIAAEIARGLKAGGRLGKVTNLDLKMADDAYNDLIPHFNDESRTSPNVLLVTLPVEHISVLARLYKKAAVYISPNNDTLGSQYAENLPWYDRVYSPSKWCTDTIAGSGYDREKIVTIPIGCEDIYLSLRQSARQGIEDRLSDPPQVLHMMTDGFLPGRKSTIEVIKAWADCRKLGLTGEAKLTLHAPSGVADEVTQYAYYYEEFEPEVTVITGPPRGEPSENLAYFMRDFDLVILPSRCEGFGMMILAALMLGIPTITTNWTGQRDFLDRCKGWVGPSGFDGTNGRYGAAPEMAEIRSKWDLGEAGLAPVISSETVGEYMGKLLDPEERKKVILAGEQDTEVLKEYVWSALRKRWINELIEWSEGT